MSRFLRAEWRKLLMANYAISPDALASLVPAHTELDLWQDTCYVSLVGFMFQRTRVMGLPIPWHINFEEVNLRFYVRYKAPSGEWRRGVVFVREIVPRTMITFVANTLFGEHYMTLPMRHKWDISAENINVQYEWQYQQQWYSMSAQALPQLQDLRAGSEEEFIAEHYWGYTRRRNGSTSQYEVEHPAWQWYEVKDYQLKGDIPALYGSQFAEAFQSPPRSVFLAEGSPIAVRFAEKISRE